MSGPRPLLAFCLAVILGVLVGEPCHARASPQPTPATTRVDEAFVDARNAAGKMDPRAFEAAVARVGPDHLLHDWIIYWRLRIRLSALRGQPGEPSGAAAALDDEIAVFLRRAPGVLPEMMRRDWLVALARRGDWTGFIQAYSGYNADDDPSIRCWSTLAQYRTTNGAPTDWRSSVFGSRDPTEACLTLVEALSADSVITAAEQWERFKLAMEVASPATLSRLASSLGLSGDRLQGALQHPAKSLWIGAEPRYAVIAAMQLVRDDAPLPPAFDQSTAALPLSERAYLACEVAGASMRRMRPESFERTRRALALLEELALPGIAAGLGVSDDTLGWMARAALREGDWSALRSTIEAMTPDGQRDPAWVYWRARALRETGAAALANNLMRSIAGQYHFYGQLAAEDLGDLTAIPARASPPSTAEMTEAARNPGLLRALKLYELGLRPEGNREWNFQIRTMSDRQLLAAAQFACERGVLDRCVNTADRTRAEHDFTLRFVTPFRDQMGAAARSSDLDPAWVYGLIRQESRFIRDAHSSAGAHGLMQIIPPTAQWIARKLGVRDFRIEQLGDLETNLRFGTFYLRSVLDDLDRSPLLASAGYNAGPNRPRSWRATLRAPLEGAAFAEIIPFPETRDYVKKVLSNAAFYAALLTGEPQSLKGWLGRVTPAPAQASTLP